MWSIVKLQRGPLTTSKKFAKENARYNRVLVVNEFCAIGIQCTILLNGAISEFCVQNADIISIRMAFNELSEFFLAKIIR